jgi:hypothetical protein
MSCTVLKSKEIITMKIISLAGLKYFFYFRAQYRNVFFGESLKMQEVKNRGFGLSNSFFRSLKWHQVLHVILCYACVYAIKKETKKRT